MIRLCVNPPCKKGIDTVSNIITEDRKQVVTKHVERALDLFRRREEAIIKQLRSEILFGIACDEHRANRHMSQQDFAEARRVINQLTADRMMATEKMVENARHDLIAAYTHGIPGPHDAGNIRRRWAAS